VICPDHPDIHVCICHVARPATNGFCARCGRKVTAHMHPDSQARMAAKLPAITRQRVIPWRQEQVA
jgi:hypothetical protein